jgi:hypothetical protein
MPAVLASAIPVWSRDASGGRLGVSIAGSHPTELFGDRLGELHWPISTERRSLSTRSKSSSS